MMGRRAQLLLAGTRRVAATVNIWRPPRSQMLKAHSAFDERGRETGPLQTEPLDSAERIGRRLIQINTTVHRNCYLFNGAAGCSRRAHGRLSTVTRGLDPNQCGLLLCVR
jgi:hypothetical protein